MRASTKVWVIRLTICFAVLLLVKLLLPLISAIGWIGLRISFFLAQATGYILLFAGLPFFVWVMSGSIYHTFFEPYWRAWHIHRIRNARYLKEALERGRSGA
jgi:hypothetical protein